MRYDKENFSSYYHEVSSILRGFRLPKWEDFPDLELYMDQMIVLINRYLAIGDGGEEKVVTASMINNYVKMRVMPPPVKKKYGKTHLAYLVVICSLKDALGISAIQKMFPPDLEGGIIPLCKTSSRHTSLWRTIRTAWRFLFCRSRSVFPIEFTILSCRWASVRASPRPLRSVSLRSRKRSCRMAGMNKKKGSPHRVSLLHAILFLPQIIKSAACRSPLQHT